MTRKYELYVKEMNGEEIQHFTSLSLFERKERKATKLVERYQLV